MTDQERYEQIDLPFYREAVAPILPPRVLDFHVHVWQPEHWKEIPWQTDAAGARYMVVEVDYGLERMQEDLQRLFPDRPCGAVCFGYPTPGADLEQTNGYAAEARKTPGLYPLRVTGRGLTPRDELEREIREGGFAGYKVYLNWYGDDYGSVTVEDLIGPEEMSLADALGLVVLLHVPRAGRLADPVVQAGVRRLAQEYPNANLVLAHCGRCYLPDEMAAAVGAIRDLPNVYLDTAMVMEPLVLQILFENVDSRRVLFATDLPVAAMRGRRVQVMDHWVDVVLDGYPPSAYRVAGSNFRATFMVYEIALAVRRGAEHAGLRPEQLSGVFYGNGMALLQKAMRQ